MKMTLGQNALGLIKYILINTGEKEINAQGQEVDAQRRLNGEESSQRRHYLNAVNPLLDEKREKLNKLLETTKEAWKTANPKTEKEEEKAYEVRMSQALVKDKAFNDAVVAITQEPIEITLTNKTVAVIKKYVSEFGAKVGWLAGDDLVVEEINEAIK